MFHNKRMRRLAAIAVACGVTLSLAACSQGGDKQAAAKKDGNYKVSFIQGVIGDPFYVTMQCSMQKEAKKLGVALDVQGPQKFDPTLQRPVLDSVVAKKPDGILIAPTDVSAMQQPLEQASKSGIKVGLVDTTVKDPSFAITSVSSDNEAGGKTAFEAIKKLVPGGGKVMVIDNQPGISTSDARVKGFTEGVKTDSKFTFIGTQYVHNDTSKAAQVVNATLQEHPDLVAIFASNTFGGIGAATGVRQAGKEDVVKIVTFDAGPDQVKALKEGSVQALIAQSPGDIGREALDQMVKALKGEKTKKKIPTKFTIITKDNVDKPDGKAAIYVDDCNAVK